MKSKKCIHCGKCCLSGVPCAFGQILFNITPDNPMACPACEKIDGLYWCGIIKNPQKYLSSLVGDVDWKIELMVDIAKIYIGIGMGCCNNPSVQEITKKMKNYFQELKEG